MRESYDHMALMPLRGGSERDELTNTSLAASKDGDESKIADLTALAPKQSSSERMAAQVAAWHAHHVKSAWEALHEGDYRRAEGGFENALVLEPADVRSSVGLLLCAAMDTRFNTATAYLRNLLNDDEDLLTVRCPFKETLVDWHLGDRIIDELSTLAASSPSDPGLVALRAYLLWLDGRDDQARSAANALQRNDPGSEFVALAERMGASDEFVEGAEEQPLPTLRALSTPAGRRP